MIFGFYYNTRPSGIDPYYTLRLWEGQDIKPTNPFQEAVVFQTKVRPLNLNMERLTRVFHHPPSPSSNYSLSRELLGPGQLLHRHLGAGIGLPQPPTTGQTKAITSFRVYPSFSFSPRISQGDRSLLRKHDLTLLRPSTGKWYSD